MVKTCEKCGGTGYIVVERDGLTGAQRCECYSQLENEQRFERARIPANFAEKNFENFKMPDDNPIARDTLSSVFTLVRTYARQYPQIEPRGLLLIGNPGSGKTHLAVAALRALILRGFGGLFCDYQELLTRIQRGWSDLASDSDQNALQEAMDADILLIDDLGARRRTEHAEDLITELITHRYNRQLPVIVTTNLLEPAVDYSRSNGKTSSGQPLYGRTISEIVGERTRSRLFEMCRVIRMPVEDYRLRKR